MSLIRLYKITKKFEEKTVLRELFFRLSEGNQVGLIGKNGSGKTTILRLILGQEEPTEGEVQLEEGIRIGYFSQFSELHGDQSIEEILEGLFTEVHAIDAELKEIESELGDQRETKAVDDLLRRQAALLERMNQIDGWNYKNRIDTVLTRLSFNPAHRTRPVEQLSGGWRNRAALARILLQKPEVLLLDEPTNYLDVEGLAWLEQWLNKLRGALIIVSHDRHFLDLVVNRIVEVENYQLQEYEGNFSQYVREKQTRIKLLQNQFMYEEELLIYEAEAIADRKEAARNPGKALKRRLANIKKKVEPKPVDRIVTGIYSGLRVKDSQCQIEDIGKAYDDQILFMELTLELRRGHRIVVVGPNGCGKSTLLRLLTLREAPDDGRINWRPGAQFSDFNQVFADLDPDDTITHAVNLAPLAFNAQRKHVNNFLGLMQFSEMDLRQKIGTLSGGQKSRVALALCLLSGASTILLDEPTNHLDLTSTQVMERALVHFPGSVIAVSHDRFFIDKVANRMLVFEEEGIVRLVEGNWTIWQSTLQNS